MEVKLQTEELWWQKLSDVGLVERLLPLISIGNPVYQDWLEAVHHLVTTRLHPVSIRVISELFEENHVTH